MIILLCILIGITIANSFLLYLLYYYVNRNWEQLLDFKNQLNALDKTIYYTYNKKR